MALRPSVVKDLNRTWSMPKGGYKIWIPLTFIITNWIKRYKVVFSLEIQHLSFGTITWTYSRSDRFFIKVWSRLTYHKPCIMSTCRLNSCVQSSLSRTIWKLLLCLGPILELCVNLWAPPPPTLFIGAPQPIICRRAADGIFCVYLFSCIFFTYWKFLWRPTPPPIFFWPARRRRHNGVGTQRYPILHSVSVCSPLHKS